MNKSGIETSFEIWLGQNEHIPTPQREYQFHPTRQWRFDFAWVDHKFAVEIEGLTYGGGRHQRLHGFLGDAEKYESAMLLGWTVFRVPGQWVQQGERAIWRQEVMDTIRKMLEAQNDRQRV